MIRKTFGRRLARLERAARIDLPPPPNLFFHFVSRKPTTMTIPGRAQCEGREWARRDNETEQDFQDRVVSDLESAGHQPPHLIFLFG
jgi:hypothetical protein